MIKDRGIYNTFCPTMRLQAEDPDSEVYLLW